MVWFATTVGTDLTYLDTLGPFVLGGFGVSLAIPCGQSAVIAAVADRDVATASGVNATLRFVRTNSAAPSSRSRAMMDWLSGGWLRPSPSAARPKCSVCATATKCLS